jgi:hypothetical protein
LLGQFARPGEALAHLRRLGVTHMVYRRDACPFEDMDLQSEVAFHFLAEREAAAQPEVDGWRIAQLPGDYNLVGPGFGTVTYLGCGHRGQVAFTALDATWEADRKKSPADMTLLSPADEAMFDGALSIVVDNRCAVEFPPGVADRFTRATHWREAVLWIRKRGH